MELSFSALVASKGPFLCGYCSAVMRFSVTTVGVLRNASVTTCYRRPMIYVHYARMDGNFRAEQRGASRRGKDLERAGHLPGPCLNPCARYSGLLNEARTGGPIVSTLGVRPVCTCFEPLPHDKMYLRNQTTDGLFDSSDQVLVRLIVCQPALFVLGDDYPMPETETWDKRASDNRLRGRLQ